MKKDTSWEEVAPWYDDHLEEDGTYHNKVILPNLLRVANLTGKERVLDLACGQGFFTRALAAGAKEVIGVDLSPSLIERAKAQSDTRILYEVSDASSISFAKNGAFDLVVCVLALQNIEKLTETVAEVDRVLAKGGRFIFVLNHPAFRIPKASSWGYDDERKIQYRRMDAYLSSIKEKIDMTPGSAEKIYTVSFHRSLQEYMKALRSDGFAIIRLEEWISHRKSQPGQRMEAEDFARKEFPLFMMLEARKIDSK